MFTTDLATTPVHVAGMGFIGEPGLPTSACLWQARWCHSCAPSEGHAERLRGTSASPRLVLWADPVCGPAGDTWPYFRPNFVNMEQYGTDHDAEEVASSDLLAPV